MSDGRYIERKRPPEEKNSGDYQSQGDQLVFSTKKGKSFFGGRIFEWTFI